MRIPLKTCRIRLQMRISQQLNFTIAIVRSGFRGGGGRFSPRPTRIRPPADPKVPPLVLFKKWVFGRPTLKFFKRHFFVKMSAKKKAIFLSKPVFFSKICLRRRKFALFTVFIMLQESSKINLFDLKKKLSKCSKLF